MKEKMAERSTSVVNSIERLTLADTITGMTGSAPDCPKSARQDVVGALVTLIQSCEAMCTHAQQAKALVEVTHAPSVQGIVKLSDLRRRTITLARITEIISDATERYILSYITSLAGPGSLAQKMLPHYTTELRSIVRDVLNSTEDDRNVLRETLEMCYGQALHTSGALHSDNYLIPLGEASLEWPYDPDFESEDYYEHENRLDIDYRYAEAFRVQCERKCDNERRENEEWIRFWVQALGQCPDGPTLFYSPASQLTYPAVPRYLFRAFDNESSGRNDQYVVASAESISAMPLRSRVDLLSRTTGEITQMLYSHLTKSCFGGKDTDNLMSWSSSLLFVLQYAIWRCHQRRCGPTEIQICTIDTRKFPRGQFARDMSLLRAYREAPELDNKTRSFFKFRLENSYYDNGEYLSQGTLHHAGRSSTECLFQLIQKGLHDLYPEFAETTAMSSWTNRVGSLRTAWSIEHPTTSLDIVRAVEIARACFKKIDTPDIALLLLSFKNRKLRGPVQEGKFRIPLVEVAKQIFWKGQEHRRNYDDCGPDEVQRYMTNADRMMSKGRENLTPLSWLTSNCQLLEGVFECS